MGACEIIRFTIFGIIAIRHPHSHRRIDHAWADSIDHNALVRIFKGGGTLCQTNNGVLAG